MRAKPVEAEKEEMESGQQEKRAGERSNGRRLVFQITQRATVTGEKVLSGPGMQSRLNK